MSIIMAEGYHLNIIAELKHYVAFCDKECHCVHCKYDNVTKY